MEVGRDMDGKIITEIINDDYLKNNSVKYIDTYEQAQPVKTPVPELIEYDDDIKNHLKELVYMD
ncbi:MAG: hypothetical protein LWW97_03745 [Deltaproteobacteria bacterium]|nr:hypothetical protein [Deltaproteobacteria bacterium]